MKELIIFFTTFSSCSQKLHHQMLSSQGGTALTSVGVTVRQTIGQKVLLETTKIPILLLDKVFNKVIGIKL